MGDFNSLFPNFLTLCLSLKSVLTPIAFLLITSGLIASTIAHHRSGFAQLQSVGKVIVFVILLVFLPTWGNQIVTIVSDLVTNTLNVNPANLHDQYQSALQMRQSSTGNQSWWQRLFSFPSLIEALISAAFMVLGWLASAIEWWAYILQTAILFVGYSLSPIFIGMLAFPSLQATGRHYLLNLLGVMLWPLGWGVAGLITQGMLTFMTDQSFLSSGGVSGTLGYSLQNLMGLAFLGLWIIFSTIAAPLAIQKSIATGQSAVAGLFSGTASAGRAAAMTGANILADSGGGIKNAIAAGAMATAAATESVATSALGDGGASLVGSLAQKHQRAQERQRDQAEPSTERNFPPEDPSGDKTVANLIDKSRN